MNPYWATFERLDSPTFLNLGVGVTARSEDDARRIIECSFPGVRIAQLRLVRDVDTLDQHHVVPNMGNLLARGVWFPLGLREGSLPA